LGHRTNEKGKKGVFFCHEGRGFCQKRQGTKETGNTRGEKGGGFERERKGILFDAGYGKGKVVASLSGGGSKQNPHSSAPAWAGRGYLP